MMFTRAGAAADFLLDFYFFAEGGWHTELKKDMDIYVFLRDESLLKRLTQI